MVLQFKIIHNKVSFFESLSHNSAKYLKTTKASKLTLRVRKEVKL